MKILIAEDEPVTRRALKSTLEKWKHDVIVVSNGSEAWKILQYNDPPRLAILDWMMPYMSGVDICRKVRNLEIHPPIYIILLTVKRAKEDIVKGLEAGANDYLTKPFHHAELRARVQVGIRTVELQSELTARVNDLEQALAEVKTLKGLLPICSYCKKIRDDDNYWRQIEDYMMDHSDATFSHAICPECYKKIFKPEVERLKTKKGDAAES